MGYLSSAAFVVPYGKPVWSLSKYMHMLIQEVKNRYG